MTQLIESLPPELHGGECVHLAERSSAASARASCAFCTLAAREPLQGGPAFDRVLCSTLNFYVVPTKGALLEGWLLVVPRRHVVSLGALPRSQLIELHKVVQTVSSVLARHYDAPALFEHGPAGESSSLGCGVDHAHLHLVPMTFQIGPECSRLLGAPAAFSQTAFWSNLPIADLYGGGTDYLMLQEAHRDFWLWTSPPMVSQFFRKRVATALNIPDQYDYRAFPFDETADRTVVKLGRELQSCAARIAVPVSPNL